jgi:hypothetical protein
LEEPEFTSGNLINVLTADAYLEFHLNTSTTLLCAPGTVTHFEFPLLKEWTQNFMELKFSSGGRLLGSGGFGSVYLGTALTRKF